MQYILNLILKVVYHIVSLFEQFFNNKNKAAPVSVNYHFSRVCNYQCKFCFHTETNKFMLPLERAKKGLKILADAGMKKINFAGGEPFLQPKHLGELIRYCKDELSLESVSIVSNASKLKDEWFEKFGEYVDVLAVSLDSFDEKTNIAIGRTPKNVKQSEDSSDKKTNVHVENARKAAQLCSKHGIKFKINTVVCRYNLDEDMTEMIQELNPIRWKVFQVLRLEGENYGESSKRDVVPLEITSEEFKDFLRRHQTFLDSKVLVPEDNDTMKNSYLVLDEEMRFLDSSNGGKVPSESLLDVGVKKAMEGSGFDNIKFVHRGGKYDWQRDNNTQASTTTITTCGSLPTEYNW
eukprot:TRINITY_DN2942_c0_g1_i3.p1 TRINITY_DN2942_c0_g1~~TRINITY_DN2942_c0_g1_i3.p1  ORF type:complete len:350 (+),score=84.04 TRINITY_DN2942_c0_g1_i3:70-1119(+)